MYDVYDQAHRDFLAGNEYELAARDRALAERREAAVRVADFLAATRVGEEPPPTSEPAEVTSREDGRRRFVDLVMAMHQVSDERTPGRTPVCTCGTEVLLCPYQRAAVQYLGEVVRTWSPA